jgi:hypothetical protein
VKVPASVLKFFGLSHAYSGVTEVFNFVKLYVEFVSFSNPLCRCSTAVGDTGRPAHQHNRYVPPIDVITTVPHEVVAPLASTDAASPEDGKRSKGVSVPQVSKTQN